VARLMADENVPLQVIEALRLLGHDVVLAGESRQGSGAPDSVVLSEACLDQRAVLTLDRRDFIQLHRQQPDHEGIIVCTFDPDFVGQAARIHAALPSGGPLRGTLLRVNRPPR